MRPAVVSPFVFLLVAGCAQIIGASDYTTETGSSSSSGSGCPSTGSSCFCGTPSTREEFLNACTDVECVPFDASRVTMLEPSGGRPDLPAGTGGSGTTASSSASTTSSTTSSTGTGGPTNDCADLPNPVFIAGSSAAKPFLSVIAQALAAKGEMTAIYQAQGSCSGVGDVLHGDEITGTGTYWDGSEPNVDLAARSCDLDPAGQVVDVGISDVFATTCFTLPQGLPGTYSDTFGPVQAMTMVSPAGSSEKSISADAAYFVYGFGKDSGVAPWNDESFIFQRSPTSGTQNIIASSIGVPADRFQGIPNATSDAMLAALIAAGMTTDGAEKAIGLLAADFADTNRSKLKILAFEDVGQTCGYYPDSTSTSLDKRNVRDGHYWLWGPLHFITTNPPAANPGKLVNYLSGVDQVSGLNLIQIYVDAHVVPLCAMAVTRKSDGGPLEPYEPPLPCGCAFEKQATGSNNCTPCTATSDCTDPATPNCSFGYCEK